MNNYIISTRTENVWGEKHNDIFKVGAKTAGAAAVKAREIIFDRFKGDIGAIREVAILDIQRVEG